MPNKITIIMTFALMFWTNALFHEGAFREGAFAVLKEALVVLSLLIGHCNPILVFSDPEKAAWVLCALMIWYFYTTNLRH